MKALLIAIALPLGLAFAAAGQAQVPAAAPAGSTGLCKDGSYTSADAKKGACRGHKGVKDWYAADAAAPAATKSTSASDTKESKSKDTPAATASTAAAPAGSTGQCKDGSYTDTDTKKGACRGHKGVKDWYGATAAAAAPAPKAAPAPAPTAAPAPARPAAPAPTRAAPASTTAATAPAPGGGAGKVWVNSESKVYHCADDRYYGKTKQGEYMTEADALAKGNHASHGKACSK
ncbi:MAG: DUF3761 domain-containing protein [Dokdonella sp.]